MSRQSHEERALAIRGAETLPTAPAAPLMQVDPLAMAEVLRIERRVRWEGRRAIMVNLPAVFIGRRAWRGLGAVPLGVVLVAGLLFIAIKAALPALHGAVMVLCGVMAGVPLAIAMVCKESRDGQESTLSGTDSDQPARVRELVESIGAVRIPLQRHNPKHRPDDVWRQQDRALARRPGAYRRGARRRRFTRR